MLEFHSLFLCACLGESNWVPASCRVDEPESIGLNFGSTWRRALVFNDGAGLAMLTAAEFSVEISSGLLYVTKAFHDVNDTNHNAIRPSRYTPYVSRPLKYLFVFQSRALEDFFSASSQNTS